MHTRVFVSVCVSMSPSMKKVRKNLNRALLFSRIIRFRPTLLHKYNKYLNIFAYFTSWSRGAACKSQRSTTCKKGRDAALQLKLPIQIWSVFESTHFDTSPSCSQENLRYSFSEFCVCLLYLVRYVSYVFFYISATFYMNKRASFSSVKAVLLQGIRRVLVCREDFDRQSRRRLRGFVR